MPQPREHPAATNTPAAAAAAAAVRRRPWAPPSTRDTHTHTHARMHACACACAHAHARACARAADVGAGQLKLRARAARAPHPGAALALLAQRAVQRLRRQAGADRGALGATAGARARACAQVLWLLGCRVLCDSCFHLPLEHDALSGHITCTTRYTSHALPHTPTPTHAHAHTHTRRCLASTA
jgi:hypothetical protein